MPRKQGHYQLNLATYLPTKPAHLSSLQYSTKASPFLYLATHFYTYSAHLSTYPLICTNLPRTEIYPPREELIVVQLMLEAKL